METSSVGLRHGINIIEKLTQKDIMNINEKLVEQDNRNLGAGEGVVRTPTTKRLMVNASPKARFGRR